MRAARAKRLAASRFLFLAAASLASFSCRIPAVGGFPWKDASGASMPFTQKASWPRGEEGHFTAGRRSNAYVLERSFLAPAGSALVVSVGSGTVGAAPTLIRLVLGPARDASSPTPGSSFSLQAERESFVLPFSTSSRIASLGVESEGGGDFTIESIESVSAFRGFDRGGPRLRVSGDFSYAAVGGDEELVIHRPFAGLKSDRAGLLIDYGPSPRGDAMRLDALTEGGRALGFTIRAEPGGARMALDAGLLPLDAAGIRLRIPEGMEVKAFYAAELDAEDYDLADLGRVLLDGAPLGAYSVYRWDLLPSVLVFDFKDYATQDRYLKRLAFFAEKLGFRGKILSDRELASMRGWNAHDYGPDGLADFFRAAREKGFPLRAEEIELEGVLLRAGIIRMSEGRIGPGEGAMISISRESSEALRWTFAVHESAHAIFFSDAGYRAFARSLWSSLDRREKWFWKTYFGWAGYDVASDYLMGNEFQAYLLQQPTADAEEYFTKRKAPELLKRHPELKEKMDSYMAEFGASFQQRAKTLEAWLYGKYGVEAGRTILVTRAGG